MARFNPWGRCALTLAGCAALLAILVAFPAAATTAVHLTDVALVEGSDLIVHGDVTHVRSEWVGRDLVTIASVRVADSLKGAVGDTVDVVLPGGADASGPYPVAVTWPGAPTLIQGEEAVLFLNRYAPVDGGFAVAGWSQGKFTVVEAEAGGKQVRRDLSGLTLARGESRARGAVRSERLDDLKSRVRGILAGGEVER